jgi:hypothetical protein
MDAIQKDRIIHGERGEKERVPVRRPGEVTFQRIDGDRGLMENERKRMCRPKDQENRASGAKGREALGKSG